MILLKRELKNTKKYDKNFITIDGDGQHPI